MGERGQDFLPAFFVCVFLNYCHNVSLLSWRRHILSLFSIYMVIPAFCATHMLLFRANRMVQQSQSSTVSCFIAAQSIENTTNRKLTWVRIGTGPTVVLISGKSTSNHAPNSRSKAESTGRQSKLGSVSLPPRLDYRFNEII